MPSEPLSKPDFIQDYIFYNSGNMSPVRYHRWCAISILAMAVGRRVYIERDYLRVYTDHYICLVGSQGIRKTTAKDEAKKLLLDAIPDYPIGASVSSREKIIDRLSNEDGQRSYTDETGATVQWHPMAFFINELKNFMSINPAGMVEFLTDIYDSKFFDCDTYKHGLQPVINPCVNILACETPNWIIDKLKLNILAGGFSRRLLYAYEIASPVRIAFPKIPTGGLEARERCVRHLQQITSMVGPFEWDSQQTMDLFADWDSKLKAPEDDIMAGFYEAKDTLVLKVSMCLALAKPNPQLLLTWDIIQLGIAFINTIEENLPKLTIAAGRNELAVPTQALLDLLESRGGGLLPEKTWHKEALKNMTEYEYRSVRQALRETEQIFAFPHSFQLNGSTLQRTVVVTARKYAEMLESGEVKVQNKQ